MFLSSLNLILPISFGAENICFLYLLHISKCNPDHFHHSSKQYEPWSDCSKCSSLIWVHIVCNICYQSSRPHLSDMAEKGLKYCHQEVLPTTGQFSCIRPRQEGKFHCLECKPLTPNLIASNIFENRVDPDQAALVKAAWSGSTLFAYGHMIYLILHKWTWQVISLFYEGHPIKNETFSIAQWIYMLGLWNFCQS